MSARAKRRRRLRRRDTVWLTEQEFKALIEYSYTLPTGTRVGKRWRRRTLSGWYFGEYVDDPSPDLVRIRWRPIRIR